MGIVENKSRFKKKDILLNSFWCFDCIFNELIKLLKLGIMYLFVNEVIFNLGLLFCVLIVSCFGVFILC